MGGKRKAPARATGPRCRGGYPVFAFPIDRRLRLRACAGTQHLFVVVRRRSCVVSGAWSSAALLPAAVLCERARCARGARRRARAWCCPVAAAVAAVACALRRSRRRARMSWKVRARWLHGARAGCQGGVRLASCPSCGQVVASLLRRRACALPGPVLEMSLMPPQVVGAVAAAVSLLCVVRAHGVAGGPRGTAARGAAAVLAWRWR